MIYYFSGTGNTKWAATYLAQQTNDELIFIPDIHTFPFHIKLKPHENVGFCFPVHGWRPPTLVRQFINNLTIQSEDEYYVYSLVTAGDNIGETIDILRSDLAKRNIPLHASCSLIMPESYVGLPFMDVDTKEKEDLKIKSAQSRLERFANAICNQKRGYKDLTIGNWPKINSRIIGAAFYKWLITDKPFHVVEDRCLKCGKCANVCSINNITYNQDKLPVWNHKSSCMTCFSCYHHCPTHAIEFGGRTKHKGQYFFNHNK